MQSRKNQPQKSDSTLGEFEALVLMAVLHLGENAYGMKVHQEIEERAERRSSLGALYTTLERLEEKGFVSSRVGESTPERGGRAKKYFKVTAAGASALKRSVRATLSMAHGLRPLLGMACD